MEADPDSTSVWRNLFEHKKKNKKREIEEKRPWKAYKFGVGLKERTANRQIKIAMEFGESSNWDWDGEERKEDN